MRTADRMIRGSFAFCIVMSIVLMTVGKAKFEIGGAIATNKTECSRQYLDLCVHRYKLIYNDSTYTPTGTAKDRSR